MNNFFRLPSPLLNKELFETLIEQKNLRIERIISTGQVTPPDQWYDQAQNEWIILLQGEAILSNEQGNKIRLKTGDYLLIEAHQKHRVEFTSVNPPCIWLAVHFFPND